MAGLLLDTNHLSAAIHPVSPLRQRLDQAHRKGIRLGTCVPVLCELEAGICQMSHADAYRRQLQQLLKRVRIWPLDPAVAFPYGDIFNDLKARGRILSQVDMMLAAMAKLNGYTILTSDQDFQALPAIHCENWLI